jgi:hypothetical protein
LTDQQEQRALLEAMAQLVLQGLERKEAQVLQERERKAQQEPLELLVLMEQLVLLEFL